MQTIHGIILCYLQNAFSSSWSSASKLPLSSRISWTKFVIVSTKELFLLFISLLREITSSLTFFILTPNYSIFLSKLILAYLELYKSISKYKQFLLPKCLLHRLNLVLVVIFIFSLLIFTIFVFLLFFLFAWVKAKIIKIFVVFPFIRISGVSLS